MHVKDSKINACVVLVGLLLVVSTTTTTTSNNSLVVESTSLVLGKKLCRIWIFQTRLNI